MFTILGVTWGNLQNYIQNLDNDARKTIPYLVIMTFNYKEKC